MTVPFKALDGFCKGSATYLPQHVLLDLAGRGLGELGYDHDRLGSLVVGYSIPYVVDDLLLCHFLTRSGHDERPGPLPPLLIWHRHHGSLEFLSSAGAEIAADKAVVAEVTEKTDGDAKAEAGAGAEGTVAGEATVDSEAESEAATDSRAESEADAGTDADADAEADVILGVEVVVGADSGGSLGVGP